MTVAAKTLGEIQSQKKRKQTIDKGLSGKVANRKVIHRSMYAIDSMFIHIYIYII